MVIYQNMRVRPEVDPFKDRHSDKNLKADPKLGNYVIIEKRQVGYISTLKILDAYSSISKIVN